jgi:hypothetical protein
MIILPVFAHLHFVYKVLQFVYEYLQAVNQDIL